MNKNYDDEIAIRQDLIKRIQSGIKPTSDETLWMDTHKEFSLKYGYPYLQKDYIELKKSIDYNFTLTIISSNYPPEDCDYKEWWAMNPGIIVPGRMGGITTDGQLFRHGKPVKNKEVKMLIFKNPECEKVIHFRYHSVLGGMAVFFECMYVDYKMHNLKTGALSQHASYDMNMIREDIEPNRVIYRCKGKDALGYDSLVFQLEWSEMAE